MTFESKVEFIEKTLSNYRNANSALSTVETLYPFFNATEAFDFVAEQTDKQLKGIIND